MTDPAGKAKGTVEDRHKSIVDYMEAGDRAILKLDYKGASKMYKEAIQFQAQLKAAQQNRSPRRKQSSSPTPPRVMEPSLKLGVCLCELARYQEAENILTGCLDKACDEKSNTALDEALYVRVLTALAALYQAQSKYDAAIELHEKAIPIARSFSSSTSLGLADNIAAYAETLRKFGHLSQAESHHREALSIRTRAVEERSCTELELAVSYTQLGCTLAGMQNHQEAYQQHHRALTLRYRYLDFSHGLVSESLNYCAESLCAIGRGGEGVPLALHAVEIRKSIFGTSHPAYAHALSVLASCYHSVGRHFDACDCLDKCLGICEVAFHKNHANIIPNLMNYGNVLRSTGDLTRARAVFQRAISIHQLNFKNGQQARQLKKCRAEVEDLTVKIEEMESSVFSKITCSTISCSSMRGSLTDTSVDDSLAQKQPQVTAADIESKGTPVIVFTDIGRDVDDEMALVLLSALKRKNLLNPIAVITTLSPEKDRAHLARGSLDTMGMADVPVGVGGRGGLADGVELEVYAADHSRPSPSIHDSGMELAVQALESVPDKSAQIVILASMSDMAQLIEAHQELFTSKVKEVVIMGGVNPMDSGNTLSPDSAYNNNCDLPAANLVYERCQELGVPTMTLSRWAAYGCPVRPKLMDELAKTKHMVAANIRRKSKDSLEQLWNKVILPCDHPRREKLPARCDTKWFYKTFCGTEDVPEELPTSIWSQVEKLNMYDPLAVLICVSSYRDRHFSCKVKNVNGVDHLVVGTSESETGISNHLSLYKEYSSLFVEALQEAMHEPEMPLGSEKEPDMLIEETTKLHYRLETAKRNMKLQWKKLT